MGLIVGGWMTSCPNPKPNKATTVDSAVHNIDQGLFEELKDVYVIPGGGSGYPEWTRRRTIAAATHFNSSRHALSGVGNTVFLALSAGSLNAPNAHRRDDNRILFECQHTIDHLVDLGMPRNLIFGDTFSWDTVTNALTLRMFLEGVFVTHRRHKGAHITVHIFISDFHLERMKEACYWVLGLTPSLFETKHTKLEIEMHSIDSDGIEWGPGNGGKARRVAHERAGVERIRGLQNHISDLPQLFAYLTMGGHQGLHRYVHSTYTKSVGVGWK